MHSMLMNLAGLSAAPLALLLAWANPGAAAILTVTDLGDSGAPGQLRTLINAAAPGDTILIPAGTITLTGSAGEDLNASGDLDIRKDLTIQGAGAGVTIIDGGGTDRVFHIFFPANVAISRLTIRNGNPGFGADGGGIRNVGTLTLADVAVTGNTASIGGGIANAGKATLSNVIISSNSSSFDGGGIANLLVPGSDPTRRAALTLTNVTVSGNASGSGGLGDGGGINNFNTATLTMTNVTVSGNTSSGNGGGINNFFIATLTNVTVSGNKASSSGGGIANGGITTLTNVTVSGNSSGSGGGIRNSGTATLTNVTVSGNSTPFDGGGIANTGTATLSNVLLGGNAAGVGLNCSGTVASLGHNLDSGSTCSFTGPGDLSNTDPELGPLQNNGGFTATHALLPGSPAIDAGTNSGCPATDQRGFGRPADGDSNGTAICDIGAYEFGAGAGTRFVATTGNDSSNTCLASGSPCKTITHALSQAVAGDTISVAAGTYNLALGETFPLTINKNLTLAGAGAGSTNLDATGANQRVITISSGTVTIAGVTITGGAVSCTNTGSSFCNATGGGLFNAGTATLTNGTVSGNTASCTNTGSGSCFAGGGGLFNAGTAALTNVTVSGNTASCTNSNSVGGPCLADGGGLFGGTAMLTNVTVSGNTANQGGGFMLGGTVTLTNVTLSGNTAIEGGGISNNFTNTTVSLKNTLIANSHSGGNCFGFNPFTSLGHNLSSDTTCGFSGPGDLTNTNPLLGPLQDNGGPTQTHALLPGSPAIDAGTNSGCPPTDQRGVIRPVGASCDIGAVEQNTPATAVVGAVLPTERTALIGAPPVTAFGTIINGGAVPATGCAIAPFTPVPATFLYQTTDPRTNALTGSPNTPAAIPVGGLQTFVFALTPTAPFGRTELQLSFDCADSAPAPIVSGVNTFFLRATPTPAPDVVALGATLNSDGIVRLASTGVFAVATVNLGAPGLMTVSADTGGVALPVSVAICETNPQTGVCLAPPTPTVQTQINSGATPTFGVFVTGTAPIPFDPANNRIQVHFEGDGGGGGTSVAVCTVPLCP